jgi:predicted amidohydrolase
MHVAAVQFDIRWEDKAANHAIVEAMLDEASLPAGTFVLLPELGDTGFSFDLDRIVDDRSVAWASTLASRHAVWLQVGHAIRGADGRGRNCATIIGPDGAVGPRYEKVHPFSFGREAEYFGGGDAIVVTRCGDGAVCPLICYDLRFPELWRLAVAGADAPTPAAEVFTIGASWPDARQAHWRALLIARAIENQAYVVAANRIGSDPHLSYAGGSIIVAPSGAVLAEADDAPAVLEADLDLHALRQWRNEFPALRDVHPGLLGAIDRTERAGEGQRD